MMNHDFIKIDDKVSQVYAPLSNMITYLEIGLILYSFQINIGYLSYLTVSLGTLMMYLALRTVRHDQRFSSAYRFSLLLMIFRLLFLFFLATPQSQIADYLAWANIFLYLSLAGSIYYAFYQLLAEKKLAHRFFISYLLLQILGLISITSVSQLVLIILFLIDFVWLIQTLQAIRKDLLEKQYGCQFSLIRFNASLVIAGYLFIIFLTVTAGFYYTSRTSYKYITPSASPLEISDFSSAEVYAKAEKNVIFSEDMNVDVQYTCYQKNDERYHLIHFEWLDIPSKTYAVETKMTYNDSRPGMMLSAFSYLLSDGKNSYKSAISDQIELSLLGDTIPTKEIKTFINPQHNTLSGDISFITENNSPLSECVLNFHFQNYFQWIYQDEHTYNRNLNNCQLVISFVDREIKIREN